MKKKCIIFIIALNMIFATSCQPKENTNVTVTIAPKEDAIQSTELEVEEVGEDQQQEEETVQDSDWQEAYKSILANINSNLTDIYDLRYSRNVHYYLGVHDFNQDEIPELIIADSVSVAIFTYSEGTAKKIVDLYEPEYWGGVNGFYYQDNTIYIVSSGSDGSCYVCFTFVDGNYMTATYDEYLPKIAILNNEEVKSEEFKQYFDLTYLLEDSRIPYITIKTENENIIFQIEEDIFTLDDFNYDAFTW